MGTALGDGIQPAVVYKGHDGKPSIPVVLSGQGVEAQVLFHPLVLVFSKPVSLWVECGADVPSYP